MSKYQAVLNQGAITLSCKKGTFEFYNGEICHDSDIAKQFPRFFVEIKEDAPEAPAPIVAAPAPVIEAVAEAVAELVAEPEAPVEEPATEEVVEEAAAEEAEVEVAGSTETPADKQKSKPGRKPGFGKK